MAFVDYYKILGVDKNIRQEDVREAYRKRAKQFHPDLHPNDPKAKAKFQALNEAYDVISDKEKRAKYDKYGEQWKNMDAFNNANNSGYYQKGGFSGFDGFNFDGFGQGGDFSDFFKSMFGNGSTRRTTKRQSRANANAETGITVSIDLYTALLGGNVQIQLSNGEKIALKIKPETQNNTKVRLRGKGTMRTDGTYGDLIITYNVVLPKNLTEHQKSLLRQMRDAIG
ncbi:MAG: DnaJ domain-containing protein [Prevotella sp.]